jgi:hypothetical protein
MTMRMMIGLLLLALPSAGWAHAGHHDAAAKSVALVGEVVDITCFVDHAGQGAKHAACAQKCILGGSPVGLLVKDTLYVVVMSTHEPPNATLAPFAGKRVRVTGRASAQNGIHVLDMESVASAP